MSFTDRYIFTGLERRNPENFLIDSPINVRGSDLDKFQENAARLHTPWSNVPTQCPHTGSKGPQESASHQVLWSHSCVVLNEFYVWDDFINIIYINIHMSRALPRTTTLQHLWVTDHHQYNSLWMNISDQDHGFPWLKIIWPRQVHEVICKGGIKPWILTTVDKLKIFEIEILSAPFTLL